MKKETLINGLGYVIPITLLNSKKGIELIYEELIRIEFGTLA